MIEINWYRFFSNYVIFGFYVGGHRSISNGQMIFVSPTAGNWQFKWSWTWGFGEAPGGVKVPWHRCWAVGRKFAWLK